MIAARTEQAAEVTLLATCGVGDSALLRMARVAQVECADCGEATFAKDLDASTGLCGVCFEVGGLENMVQDGKMSEAEFAAEAGGARVQGLGAVMTAAQRRVVRAIRDGAGYVGSGQFNNNAANAMRRRGWLEGRGWPGDKYRLTAAGEAAARAEGLSA